MDITLAHQHCHQHTVTGTSTDKYIDFYRMFKEALTSRQSRTSNPRFKRIHHQTELNEALPSSRNPKDSLRSLKQNEFYDACLAKMRSACKIDEKLIVGKYLRTIRKDYDGQSKKVSEAISAMKVRRSEIEIMKQKAAELQGEAAGLEQAMSTMIEGSEGVASRYVGAQMQTKTLEHIIRRMHKDELIFKQGTCGLEGDLQQRRKQARDTRQALLAEERFVHDKQCLLQRLKQEYGGSNHQRVRKFDQFSSQIQDVQGREKFAEERKERTQELRSIQANDTLDDKNVHMRKVLLVSKVAAALLAKKNGAVVKRYADHNNAYHLIKTKTGITGPSSLAPQFFSYGHTTAKLFQSVELHEERLSYLQANNARLKGEYERLEQAALEDTSMGEIESLKCVREQDNRHRSLILSKLIAWTDKKVELLCGEGLNGEDLSRKMKRITAALLKGVKQLSEVEEKFQTKGIRVKKLIKELTAEEYLLRSKEEEDMATHNQTEELFLEDIRKNMKGRRNFLIKQVRVAR